MSCVSSRYEAVAVESFMRNVFMINMNVICLLNASAENGLAANEVDDFIFFLLSAFDRVIAIVVVVSSIDRAIF